MSYTVRTTTLSATSSYDLFVGYCCSACANPVVVHIKGDVESTGQIGFFGSTPEGLQYEATTCKNNMVTFLMKYLETPTVEHYPQFPVRGLNSPCPVCGSHEPWQLPELIWKMDTAGPIFFHGNLKNGYSWALEVLRGRKAASEEAGRHAGKIEKVLERYRQIEEEIRECELSKDTLPEVREVADLSEQANAYEQQLKALPVFSIKRKQLRTEMEQYQNALASAQERFNRARDDLEIRVVKLRREQLMLTFSGKGVQRPRGVL